MKSPFLPIFVAVATTALLGGCATPATRQGMALGAADLPNAASVANPTLKGTVAVAGVSGGKSTSPLWTSQVDDKGFREALEESLRLVGYLAPVGTNASHLVEVNLQELRQPLLGITFDVDSRVEYRVSGPDGQRLFPVNARGTATVSDAFFGVERLRIANERSIKENIRSFIRELSEKFR